MHGLSLGGGVATELAAQVHPAALVLESTFLSVTDAAAEPAEAAADDAPDALKADAAEPVAADARAVGRD